jgi:hypothetical protein
VRGPLNFIAMSKEKPKTSPAAKQAYKRTAREEAAVRRFLDEQTQRAPSVKVSKDGLLPNLAVNHPDEAAGLMLIMEEIGSTDLDFICGLVGQLINAAATNDKPDEVGINFMLSVIKSIRPRDQLEVMLLAQMAAVHMAAMRLAPQLSNAEFITQRDSAERAFNKLMRTYTTQMEALKRYRTGGEQKVTVQHVTVGEGGQAIVGNVTQGQPEAAQQATAAPLAIADAKTVPMQMIDESQRPISVRRSQKKT